MDERWSTVVDAYRYDKERLCEGIDLRKHVAGDLEEVGAFRAQEDWRRLVGPLEKPYRGGLGPNMSFITYAVPECLPDRMEITSYALEFGFMHDDVIDQNINEASFDEMGHALSGGGVGGEIEEENPGGKRKIAAQIIKEMMAIDPERALVVAKSWLEGVQHNGTREENAGFKTLEEYIPYRAYDVGYMLWHGLVTFSCAITIPEEDVELTKELIKPALVTASLTNDLFSFEKEKNDQNVQNAVLVVMTEHQCSEETAREMLKQRIRLEVQKYIKNVKDINARTDVSADAKRYIDTMQYTLSGNAAWSTECPRYHANAKWNKLQMLRAEHGIEKYPATYSLRGVDNPTTTNGTQLTNGHANGASNGISKGHVNGHTDGHANGTSSGLSNGVNGYPATTNGHKRKRLSKSAGDDIRSNGSNGVKRLSRGSPDALDLEDVVSLALESDIPDLSDDVVLQPYRYLISLPSKGFRDQAIDSLNTWLKVPAKSTKTIKNVIKVLHSASLMLDDLEDGSPLRRGKPSTHNIYGDAQTINSATYQYTEATRLAAELNNPLSLRIFIEETQALYVGQSYDLYWTHNAVCPSMTEYLKMVDKKTGGLFRLLTRLLLAESPLAAKGSSIKVADSDLNLLGVLIGRFFQIRDDYQNLSSADYAKQKGFAEDLDEGKYSFALIHCIQTVEHNPAFAGDAMHLQALLVKRRLEGKLSDAAKREVLATMKKTGSLEYTLGVMHELHAELDAEVRVLEEKFGEENFTLKLLLEMLKV